MYTLYTRFHCTCLNHVSYVCCNKQGRHTPFASRPSRQQHQVDLKDGVAMGQPRDDVFLALRIQVDPVLLHNAVILAEGIAQHLGSVCEACIGSQLNGCELVTGWVHSADCYLHTDGMRVALAASFDYVRVQGLGF